MKINDFLDSPQSNNQRAEAVGIDSFLGEGSPKTSALKENSQDALPTSSFGAGISSRALGIVGDLIEGTARIGEQGGDYLERKMPLSGLTEGQIQERQLDPIFKAAEWFKRQQKAINYQPSVDFQQVKADPLNLGQTGKFIVEQGANSIPDMAAAVVNLPGYVLSRINNIADERAKNEGRPGDVNLADMAKAAPGAIAEATLERFATGRLFPGNIAGASALSRIGKQVGIQAGTEGIEEVAGYAGETLGTKAGFNIADSVDRFLSGALVGGPMGGSVQSSAEVIGRIMGRQNPMSQEGDLTTTQPTVNNPIQNVSPALTDPSIALAAPAIDPIAALSELISSTATQTSPLEQAPIDTPTVDQFLGEAQPQAIDSPVVAPDTQDAFLDSPEPVAQATPLDQALGNIDSAPNNLIAQDAIDTPQDQQNESMPVQQASMPDEINAPAFIDLDKHSQLQAPKLGMRIGDIVHKNGDVFKAKQTAQAVAKKSGKGWVIVPSNQGFVVRFRPQTDKQIASNEKRIAKQKVVRPRVDSMLQAISKLGGINSNELVKDWGISLPELKGKGAGVMWVATKKGMSADRMADTLKELGYISSDPITGRHDLAEMMDAFQEEARGGAKTYANTDDGGKIAEQYSEYEKDAYDEWIAAKDAEEASLNKLSEEAQTIIGEWVGEQYDITQEEYAKLDEELFKWEQSGEIRDRIPEFNNESIDTRGGRVAQQAGEFDSQPAGEDRGDKGTNQANEDTGQKQSPVRQAGTGSQRSSEEGFGLESQTEATLKAAEEAKASANKAKQEADRAVDARAKADAEVGQFNLTGSDRTADVQAVQGQQDLLATKPDTKPENKLENKLDIKDFGEKIGGARKDVWGMYEDSLNASTTLDTANIPFSKSWPEPNYEKLIESGTDPKTVSVVRAMRDSVPTKPKKSYRLKSWVDSVETLRNFANDLVKGKMPATEIDLLGKYSAIGGLADLYMAVGHSKSLGNLRLSVGHYGIFQGKTYVPAKAIWSVEKTQASSSRRFPTQLVTADTREDAISKFKESFDTLMNGATEKKATEFAIYSRGKDKKYYVGKKVGRNYVDLSVGFVTVKEARDYRNNNQDELVAKLEKFKEAPKVRREDNNPRVGEDMRNGEDVTPEYFGNTFGFKGVEFGNWVEQGKRQADLNESFDALMDMAAVLGLPPKALSLNGELSLAFGARGRGGIDPAKAHYELDFVVINMTKKSGAGSLGHEWWHALDNYFSRMGKKPLGMMTESSSVSLASSGSKYFGLNDVRQEMTEAYGRVMKAIRDSNLKQRSLKMDAKRSKEYWNTSVEMSARSFEAYLISKLEDQGVSNDYLANIVDEKMWKAKEALGMADEGSYPYPTVDELPALRAAFDSFFQTVETAPTDKGIRIFSRVGDGKSLGRIPAKQVEALVAEIRSKFAHFPPTRILDRASTALPRSVEPDSDPRISGAVTNGEIVLFLKGIKSVNDAERTIFHELLHYGLRRFLTRDQFITQMNKLYVADESLRQSADQWIKEDAVGQDTLMLHGEQYAKARGIDEALAVLAETNPEQFFKPNAWTKTKETLRKWMAQLADFLGFKQYAAQLRSMNPTDGEQLVREVFTKLQDNAPATQNPFTDLPDTAFRIQDMEEDLQDDIDLGVPKQKFEKVSKQDFFSLSKNEFGQTQYTAGLKLYKNLSVLASEHLGALKLADNRPEAFKKMMRQFKVDQSKAGENAKRIAEAGMELSPEQRRAVADLVEQNVKIGDLPPQAVIELAAKITTALDTQASQLVDLGMLSENRLVKNYLPRLYQKNLDAKLAGDNVFKEWYGKARMKMRGERLKSRGLSTAMSVDQVAMAKKLGWEVSSLTDHSEVPSDLFDAFDKSQPIPPKYQDTKVLMWRDYTEAERAEMGEITDGIFRYAIGYVETQKDITTGRLFKAIAGNAELAKAHNPGGWKQVPTTEISGAGGVKQYGALAGLFVNPQVLDSLKNNTQPKGTLLAIYDKGLGLWKEGKTVWNPVSHSNNVVSNIVITYLAGLNPANPAHWIETRREFKTKGKYWNEAVDNGLFGHEMANEEIRDLLMPDLSSMVDLESVASSRASKVITALTTKGSWKDPSHIPANLLIAYRDKMQKAYEFEDQFFKLMIYIDRRKAGMDAHDAITETERYVFNYSDMPETVQAIKRTAIPFFSYTYNAIPLIIHTAMTRPDRLAAIWGIFAGAQWLFYAMLGSDEDEERKGLPEHMRGRTALGVNRAIRMPWNDEGKPVFLDISRRIPLGDLFDVENRAGGIPMLAPLMPNNPLFTVIQSVLYNQDTFTGDKLVKKSDAGWEAAKARAGLLYSQMMPNAPMIPGSYNFNKLMDASANTFDTEIGPYTGKTKSGDPIKAIPTLLDVFSGTKIRSFDPERGIDYQAAGIQKEAKEISANISSAQRNQGMTPDSKGRYIASQQEKLKELQRKNEELRK